MACYTLGDEWAFSIDDLYDNPEDRRLAWLQQAQYPLQVIGDAISEASINAGIVPKEYAQKVIDANWPKFVEGMNKLYPGFPNVNIPRPDPNPQIEATLQNIFAIYEFVNKWLANVNVQKIVEVPVLDLKPVVMPEIKNTDIVAPTIIQPEYIRPTPEPTPQPILPAPTPEPWEAWHQVVPSPAPVTPIVVVNPPEVQPFTPTVAPVIDEAAEVRQTVQQEPDPVLPFEPWKPWKPWEAGQEPPQQTPSPAAVNESMPTWARFALIGLGVLILSK